MAVLLASPCATASTISVANTATVDTGGSSTSTLTVNGFDLLAGNTLAVLVTSEGSSGSPPTPDVTFGDAVFQSVSEQEGSQRASVFWVIDSPTASGDVVVNLNDTINNAAVSVLSIANVGGISDAQSFGEPTSWNIDYDGYAGGVVVGAMVDNGFGSAAAPAITGDNIDTNLQSLAGQWFAGASAGHSHDYGSINATGVSTAEFIEGSNSSRNAGALVTFVPEPTSVALLCLAGLAVGARRRG